MLTQTVYKTQDWFKKKYTYVEFINFGHLYYLFSLCTTCEVFYYHYNCFGKIIFVISNRGIHPFLLVIELARHLFFKGKVKKKKKSYGFIFVSNQILYFVSF